MQTIMLAAVFIVDFIMNGHFAAAAGDVSAAAHQNSTQYDTLPANMSSAIPLSTDTDDSNTAAHSAANMIQQPVPAAGGVTSIIGSTTTTNVTNTTHGTSHTTTVSSLEQQHATQVHMNDDGVTNNNDDDGSVIIPSESPASELVATSALILGELLAQEKNATLREQMSKNIELLQVKMFERFRVF